MDCDGLKHALVQDLDGSLMQTPSSLIARAEYFSRNAFAAVAPQKFLTAQDGTLRQEKEVIAQYGIVRPGCTLHTEWNAWRCTQDPSHLHRMLIIESMDGDSDTRLIVPVALSHNGTTDLLGGGIDLGSWTYDAPGVASLLRRSTFFSVLQTGREYDLTFTGTNPQSIRYHLLTPTLAALTIKPGDASAALTGPSHCAVLKVDNGTF